MNFQDGESNSAKAAEYQTVMDDHLINVGFTERRHLT